MIDVFQKSIVSFRQHMCWQRRRQLYGTLALAIVAPILTNHPKVVTVPRRVLCWNVSMGPSCCGSCSSANPS